jgi:hypothetical protein
VNDPLFDLSWRVAVTVVTSVVSFFVYVGLNSYWHRVLRRRLRQALAEYAAEHGRREAALVLCVPDDITQSVQAYLDKQGRQGIQVFKVHQQQGFSDRAEVWFDYLEKVKKELLRIRELGVSRVYLFCKLPVALAVLTGAALANGPEVIVHHFTSGNYLEIGPLTVETVKL